MLLGKYTKKRWVEDMAEWLEMNRTTVSSWFREDRRIPEKHLKRMEEKSGYPREQWYIEPGSKSLIEEGDHELENITRLPMDARVARYLEKTRFILEARHPKITPVLRSNIEAFYDAILKDPVVPKKGAVLKKRKI